MSGSEFLDTQSPLPCPLCKKLFRLPEGFTSAHALACPHCDQQVTGRQIMEAMAPTASLVEVPQAKATSGSGSAGPSGSRPTHSFDEQNFVIPKPLKTALRSSRRSHPERAASVTVDDGKAGQTEQAKSGKPDARVPESSSSRSRSSRSRKKSKKKASPFVEFLKIILGGILALPIAQLVLWWGFSLDPLKLAPAVYEYAAVLVPPTLRPAEDVSEDADDILIDMPDGQKLNDQGMIPFLSSPGQ